MKHPPPKPLWKFGWAGYIAAAVLFLLVVALVRGTDVQFWFLSQINRCFGIKAAFWITSVWLPSHALFDFGFLPVIGGWGAFGPEMRFSLTTMCLVLIALQVHPRRTPVWGWLPVVVFGLVFPGLTLEASRWLAYFVGPRWASGSFDQVLVKWQCLSDALAFILLILATRSIRVCVLPLGLLVLGTWLNAEARRTVAVPVLPNIVVRIDPTDAWFQWLSWAWNPLFFACLLFWAIRARRAVRPEHECPDCGYDLRGSPSGTCPECGSGAVVRASRATQ